jgi:hypothetical protein
MLRSCRLCKRKCAPSSALCAYHLAAKTELESGYKRWSEAYGALSWEEYLRKIARNAETGQWIKEVAELLSSGSAD